MILILSDISDQHADRVESILKKNDAEYSRLNLDVDSAKSTRIRIENNTFRIDAPNCSFSTSQIEAVWNRSTNAEKLMGKSDQHNDTYLTWKEKWSKTLEGLFSSLGSTKWLNFYDDFYGENQISQFVISKNIGLKWPSHICTNDINYLNSFFETKKVRILELMAQKCPKNCSDSCTCKCGDMMGQPVLEGLFNINCPVKGARYKVRCSVVGTEYFVGRIRAKINESGELINIEPTAYREINPPGSIKTKVILLMNELNLTHGVFDFMVTENGEWFFDSLNPIGQYQWIEDIKNKDISSSIAKWLMMNN